MPIVALTALFVPVLSVFVVVAGLLFVPIVALTALFVPVLSVFVVVAGLLFVAANT